MGGRPDGEGFLLEIKGPGKRRIRQQCPDALAAMNAQRDYEATLIAQGFSLADCANRRNRRQWQHSDCAAAPLIRPVY